MERKGALTLRGDISNYSRPVKSGPWHQAREAEPKDYEISNAEVRNLHKSTYKSLGPGSYALPRTTYQSMNDQSELASDYVEHHQPQSMIQEDTIDFANLERLSASGPERRAFNAVFPHHPAGFDQHRLTTTHRADFVGPEGFVSVDVTDPPCNGAGDLSDVYKRCISQFADTDSHRRPGKNTWADEGGVYANTHIRRQYQSNYNPLIGK